MGKGFLIIGTHPVDRERIMLVCHCNVITQHDIEEVILSLLEADPWQLIVPAKVYHTLGKRGRCCGCFPNVVETIINVTERFHGRPEWRGEATVTHLDRVRELRTRFGRGCDGASCRWVA